MRAIARSAPGTSPRPQPPSVRAREPGPFAVRLQQLCGLVQLDPAAAKGGAELDEAEVADEPVAAAPEPFERDHSERPRPEAALAQEPGATASIGWARSASRSIVRQTRTSVDARRREPEPAELRRRERADRVARRRRLAARAHDRSLDRQRAPRLDQLAADRAQKRVRDGRRRSGRRPCRFRIDGPSSGSWRKRRANSVVSASSGEHEAQQLEPLLVRRAQHHEPVGSLPRLAAAAARQRRLERARRRSSGAGGRARAV